MTKSAELGAEIIVQLARLAQSGGGHRLTPAQWTALRFFARANRLSRTPSAFSAYNATTRGTASQTVKSLVALGLLERHRNVDDGRSALFELTKAGREVLRDDPLRQLIDVVADLPANDRTQLFKTLQGLTARLAESRDFAIFGTCSDCTHCDPSPEQGAFCRCSAALLPEAEFGALCVEFRPRAVGG